MAIKSVIREISYTPFVFINTSTIIDNINYS